MSDGESEPKCTATWWVGASRESLERTGAPCCRRAEPQSGSMQLCWLHFVTVRDGMATLAQVRRGERHGTPESRVQIAAHAREKSRLASMEDRSSMSEDE